MGVHVVVAISLLSLLSAVFASAAQAAVCDVDNDGDVDRLDLKSIVSARDKPAAGAGDPRDGDGDGAITVQDVRACIKRCSLPDCPAIDPGLAAPPAAGDAVRSAAPVDPNTGKAAKPGSASGQPATGSPKKALVGATEWKVERGDTLYGIARSIYPQDTRRQARLRQDIVALNPAVFANGANNLAIGTRLRLPAYVAAETAPAVSVEAAPRPAPEPVDILPEPTPEPAPPAPVAASEPTPKSAPSAPVTESEPGPPAAAPSAAARADDNFLLSLGYSYGGEKLDNLDETYGPAGVGAQLRLGYERIFRNDSGFRVALGLHYSRASTTEYFRDTYLNLAYQYRAAPLVYGAGVIVSGGARLDANATVDYDGATGALVYVENIGRGDLAGWGLSFTALEIEEEDSDSSFDASRAELYYSWRF